MTRTKCPECNDTGGRDSGGTYPWGEPVLLPCDCKDVEIFRQRTRQEQAMGALAKQAQELQLGYEAGESELHDMVKNFDSGHGCTEGVPFTAWTAKTVYFPICYDGAEWVGSVSRHPDGKPTEHQGGG